MIVSILHIEMRASWAHSLKEKRSVVQSIIKKMRNRFNASVIEADMQEVYQLFVLGIAFASGDGETADRMANSIVEFIEENTDAEIIAISREKA